MVPGEHGESHGLEGQSTLGARHAARPGDDVVTQRRGRAAADGPPAQARVRGLALFGRPLLLLLVVVEKAGVALVVAAAAVLAFTLRGRVLDPVSFLFAGELAEDPHDAAVHWLMSVAPHVTAHVGLWLAVGLALWAALFGVEAYGLWTQQVWGEALVILETASFLPVEVWHVLHRSQWSGWVALAVNVAVLLYVTRLYGHRPKKPA